MKSRWLVVLEALLLARELQRRPAGREELIIAIQAGLPDAFDQPSDSAQRRHFERVLANLREQLLAEVDYDRAAGVYRLLDPGPFLSPPLSDELLPAFAFLETAFAEAEEALQQTIRPLLDDLRGRIAPEQMRVLRSLPALPKLSLERLDTGEISPKVWQLVGQAIRQRRLLRFDYVSPRHEDELPRHHTAEPYELKFMRGHYYLHAFMRRALEPDGTVYANRWALYRLDHMLSEQIELLPTVFPAEQRSRRLIPLRYRIAPIIARGNVTHHFEEMSFSPPDENGWVTVDGKTTNLFDAHRILLAMGANCQALDPPELVTMLAEASSGMAALYGE